MGQTNIPPLQRSRRRTRTYDTSNDNIETEVLPAIIESLVPTGTIVPTFSDADPGGAWKLLNGQSLSKEGFPRLFAIFGSRFGATDTTFNLPDLRGRTVIGAGGDAGVDPFALAGSHEVTLSLEQVPAHSHTLTDLGHSHGFTGEPHTHTFEGASTHSHTAAVVGPNEAAEGTDKPIPVEGQTSAETVEGTIGETTLVGTVDSAEAGISIEEAGGGAPVSILPPVIGVHWLIKT